jgi:hypothetical protein
MIWFPHTLSLSHYRLFCFLLTASLASQTRLASGVTAPLAAKAVFALVLAGLLIGLGLVYQTRNSSEFAISHNSHSQANCVAFASLFPLKALRLLRRCAPRNDRSCVCVSLRAIQRISRQSQMSQSDFFNIAHWLQHTSARAGRFSRFW